MKLIEADRTTHSNLFTEEFFQHWLSVKKVIMPSWRKVMGNAPLNGTVRVLPFEESPQTESPETAGEAHLESNYAVVFFEKEDIPNLYGTIFHEALHLSAPAIGKNFQTDARNISQAEWVRLQTAAKILGNREDISALLDTIYPREWNAALRVSLVAHALDESATQAMTMLMVKQFYQDQQLDPRSILEQQYSVLFECDDPTRYPLLLAALVKHMFNTEAAARYFYANNADAILADLYPTLSTLTSINKLKTAARNVQDYLREMEGMTLDIQSYDCSETAKATQLLHQTIPELPQLRPQAKKIIPILEGNLVQAYYAYDAPSFLQEAQGSTELSTIIFFIAYRISFSYNKLLTKSVNNDAAWKREVQFCSDLYDFAFAKDPNIRFKMDTVITSLRQSTGMSS